MKLQRRPFALLFALLLAFAALAPVAWAQRGRRYDRVDVAYLAHQLDEAAAYASRLSSYRSPGYREVDAAFARLSDAAYDFHRAVENGRGAADDRRAFDRVAARYYELRGEFRYFHGPDEVRAAFHGINTPMEDLYRFYTGRDLYRDDPNVRRGGVRQRAPGYDGRYDDRYDRRDDGRNNNGRRRGHGRGRN